MTLEEKDDFIDTLETKGYELYIIDDEYTKFFDNKDGENLYSIAFKYGRMKDGSYIFNCRIYFYKGENCTLDLGDRENSFTDIRKAERIAKKTCKIIIQESNND